MSEQEVLVIEQEVFTAINMGDMPIVTHIALQVLGDAKGFNRGDAYSDEWKKYINVEALRHELKIALNCGDTITIGELAQKMFLQ